MKKSLLSLLLLGAVLLATVSCSFDPAANDIPVAGDETTAPPINDPIPVPEPSVPVPIIGKWYSESNAIFIQFFSDFTLKYFNIAPGYFAYSALTEGTYSYNGKTLVIKLEGNETDITAPCLVTEKAITIGSGYQASIFQPAKELPPQHPKYSYPDFAALAEKYPLPEGGYTDQVVANDLREQVLADLQKNYWANKKESEIPYLNSGTAKLGDMVNIDYEGFLDGVAFEGGTAKNVRLTVSPDSGYVPGFAEGIAGHSIGETFDVSLTFPENYHEDLAGKAVVFRMKLNRIYDLTLTDEIAIAEKQMNLTDWIESEFEMLLETKVWELMPSLKDGEIPEEAYQFFYQYNLDYYHAYAFYRYNNDYAALLKDNNITEEEILSDCKKIALKGLRAAQIVKKFNLSASPAEYALMREDYITAYVNEGYSREEATEIFKNEGKNEFTSQLETKLATEYLIKNNTFPAPVTETELRETVVSLAEKWLGCKESDGTHKPIIDLYNSHTPLARGYTVKYTDAWCSTFASAVAIKAGLTSIIPTECGCEKHIQLFKNINSWVEDDAYVPKPGDYIFYDWDDSGEGDCTGYSDHIGIVVSVNGTTIKVIEGNYSNMVTYRTLQVNAKGIRGYGVPDYAGYATVEETPAA